MTPRMIRQHLLDQLDIKPGHKVLDPGVGTGEFLRDAYLREPNAHYFGWDIDKEILKFANENLPSANLENISALEVTKIEEFDFVIGNPPYFELKLDQSQKKKFSTVISGRANIYALFIKVGLDLLKPGGTLAFVVPPSMNAGAYFKKLRQYIMNTGHISYLRVFQKSDHFVDAQTSVQVIVIKKTKEQSKFVFQKSLGKGSESLTIFTANKDKVMSIYEQRVTLNQLGYEAVTGNVVWNQRQEALTDEATADSVPLYYARNIKSGLLKLEADVKKKQYISSAFAQTGPAILVNRIIGGVGKGSINAAMVPPGEKFAAENHLNVIRPIPHLEQKIPLENLYLQIKALSTIEAARLITGNTQLSASEWNHLMPFSL